jgi:surface antigen
VIRRLAVAAVLVGALAGCGNTAQNAAGPIGGAAVGIGLGGITANPFVAYAAGVGTQAAIEALQRDLSRDVRAGEQNNISLIVGRLRPGQFQSWKISYTIPFLLNEHGEVTVLRVVHSPLTTCKEVAFTVVAGHKADAGRAVYITSACRESDGHWRWAEAEPALARWGFLQ